MKEMQKSLFLAVILFFAGLVFQPLLADEAYCANKQQVKKSSVSKKPVSRSKAVAGKKISGKAVAVRKPSAKKLTSEKKSNNTERELWLRRAKASEALTGKASWYGKDFHNKATASGLAYDMYTFTAAHRTLPMGTIVKVTDQNNGKSVMVCVTDRGPYVHGRIIDISYAAAKQLGLQKKGIGKVELEVVSDEHGTPLKKGHAYYVRYVGAAGKKMAGPFDAFADAAAMHEALRQAHPEAEVVLGKNNK